MENVYDETKILRFKRQILDRGVLNGIYGPLDNDVHVIYSKTTAYASSEGIAEDEIDGLVDIYGDDRNLQVTTRPLCGPIAKFHDKSYLYWPEKIEVYAALIQNIGKKNVNQDFEPKYNQKIREIRSKYSNPFTDVESEFSIRYPYFSESYPVIVDLLVTYYLVGKEPFHFARSIYSALFAGGFPCGYKNYDENPDNPLEIPCGGLMVYWPYDEDPTFKE